MKNEREIIKEFKRLNSDGKGVEEIVSEFLSTYAQALLKHTKMAKYGAGLLSTLLAIKTKNTDHTKYITCSIALLCIMVHFKENADLVIGTVVPEPQQAPIFIKFTDDGDFLNITDFYIYMDQIMVYESGDFIEAFIFYLASFYVFHISHPTGLKKSLYFMDRALLKLKDSPKFKGSKGLDKKVISLISSLNAKK